GPGRTPGVGGGGTWTGAAGPVGGSLTGAAAGGSPGAGAAGDADRPRGGFWRRLLGREDRG
ncbi:hypothetical protein MHY85_20885, partial [Cellulomonas sp. ACRRI]|nr:hypothetical protein [Cellulomonas sp. ACRRI]